MFDYKYLSREHLEGFDNYKYMAIDTSPLSVYVMHPFWNRVVEYVPRWIAPNVLTFAGFLLTVLDFLLLSWYDYDYTAASARQNGTDSAAGNGGAREIPDALWPVMAVCLFLAYTLDGIDGKQARKTQTSGPLGELFDHGLDSYSVFFIPACLYSIFGRADFSISPRRMYYVMWNVLFNFYVSHWEKYNTGVLFLPWGYDFSMWAATFFFFLTGATGTGFYKRYMLGPLTVANVFEILIYFTTFTNVPVAVYNTYQSYKLRTGKMRSFSEAMRPLIAFLFIMVVCSYWVQRSPSDICARDPRVLLLLIGTLFSNVSSRLIVAQMSSQRCDALNWLGWGVVLACVSSIRWPSFEMALFYAVTLTAVCAHVHYGACVVRQMCDHFRIGCFVIKKRTD